MSGPDIKETVREKYGQAALRVLEGEKSGCCGDPITSQLYDAGETTGLPEGAVLASLGCGNPTALAALHPGETVLDLGSGGGIDVLLSAQRVGPTGKAYGLDMTDEMLALARENQRKAGVTNVEFLKGEIENIPLPDVVVRGQLPSEVRRSIEAWVGCVAGALEEEEFKTLLAQQGFEEIGIEPTRIYRFDDARALLQGAGLDAEVLAREVDGCVMGAFVRARKPA